MKFVKTMHKVDFNINFIFYAPATKSRGAY
jgi:hypothetical protein